MRNPYHYGTPVTGDQFTGRDNELGALTARMRDGINVVLISPRRYGKTSLLRRANETMTAAGAAVVDVNVLKCATLPKLASELTSRTWRAHGGRRRHALHAIPDFARRFRVSPTFQMAGDQPVLAFTTHLSPDDAHAVISEVYTVLAEIAADKPAVLVLDEFQAITDLDPALPALLKGLADTHPQVSLVLAGSKRHLMEQLVLAPGAPLFGMAEHLALDAIGDTVMGDYLRRRARTGRKPMSAEAAAEILTLAGPVPNDIQHLAYEVYGTADARIGIDEVHAGMDRAVAHEAALHADRFERLAPGQRRVLTELALSPTAEPQGAAFTRAVGYSNPSGVRKALDALTSEDLIAVRAGRTYVADPFFAAWLRQGVDL